MRVVGAFSGIGGLELGFHRGGHETVAMAEIDVHAKAVLAERFPKVPNLGDVTSLHELPDCDIVTAGFPCQDVSLAGRTAGIHGARSGLVEHVFSAIENMNRRPEWLLFENVPFLLQLNGGRGMAWLVSRIEALGYHRWAYRIVDAQAFGLPQRRRRLYLLAARTQDPAAVLFRDDTCHTDRQGEPTTSCGFNWTEGKRGLGWAVDAIPPIRAISTAGILSMPAVWRPGRQDFVLPTVEDAEVLQGFERGWTRSSRNEVGGERFRWKLVGNAVSVRASEWIAGGLEARGTSVRPSVVMKPSDKWPKAAFGHAGKRTAVDVSDWPVDVPQTSIDAVLSDDVKTLSHRAASGFAKRLEAGNLRTVPGFKESLRDYVDRMGPEKAPSPKGRRSSKRTEITINANQAS